MKAKEKLVKEKQFTDRPQINSRYTESNQMLSRLENQYLFNQQNGQKTSRDKFIRAGDKENFAHMVNSVPVDYNDYASHNVIRIDNYEGKRFKTHQGYQPMMTKSRYMDQSQQAQESVSIYKSSQNIILRKDKLKNRGEERNYESIELHDNQRPLTFGLVKKVEPMKSSLQYKQDVKMKNQILEEMSSLRKSQQTLTGSKDYTGIGFENIPKCTNHSNKRAKYKLLTENDFKQQDDMIYCSKCAINLLQQGFKVQQIKPGVTITRKMTKSHHHLLQNNMISSMGGPSRIQQMRNFQQKLCQVQGKINKCLQESSLKTAELQQIQRQIWQTESVYQQMIEHLQKMKLSQVEQLKDKKNQKIANLQKYQKQMGQQLENIGQMKKQMKQFRNKFVIMKENQFQFLISSFLNKIHHYGNNYQQGEVKPKTIQDQIDHIIIQLCQFCKNMKRVQESRVEEGLGVVEAKGAKINKIQEKNIESEDDFICKQIKGPFRTLFPEDETNPNQTQLMGDSPSFSRNKPKFMQRSIRNNQQNLKNQYF